MAVKMNIHDFNEKTRKSVGGVGMKFDDATKIENFEGQEYGIEKESGDVI